MRLKRSWQVHVQKESDRDFNGGVEMRLERAGDSVRNDSVDVLPMTETGSIQTNDIRQYREALHRAGLSLPTHSTGS